MSANSANMSVIQPGQGRLSPALNIDLASNNPFRNRATSPRPLSQASPLIDQFPQPSPRPVSRNPFLDDSHTAPAPLSGSMATSNAAPPLTGSAAELFDNLTLEDKPTDRRAPSSVPPPRPDASSKPVGLSRENLPPQSTSRGPPPRGPPRAAPGPGDRRGPPPGAGGRPRAPTNELNIFADPSSSPRKGDSSRRPRRNSDTSVADRSSKLLDPEDEKRRQRRKERERRHRDRKERSSRTERRLDVIDKLDVTSIYGTGLFHHDGPFDACNPHRNRQGSKRAPMQAFPEGSLNNTLGGGGPINRKPDHANLMGHHDDDAFNDFNTTGPADQPAGPPGARTDAYILQSNARIDKIHGDESLGLGTSTFLEGTPASRIAIERRESDAAVDTIDGGGLSRKKSLAQRIRGINNRREYGPSGRLTNPEQIYVSKRSPDPMRSPGSTNETNPFFTEFSEGGEKKEGVSFVEPVRPGRARAPSSPQPLERRATTDATTSLEFKSEGKSLGGGFLSRVKSLKGGPRRPKETTRVAE